ncbi:hypothetical protein KC217_22505, partial [Mycobacterium tuberculosis]|nr:hypothetical protein [Mycobacterium tuberculosis]
AKETGRSARPRHRLAFLDALAAPDDLRRYLDSLLSLDPLWARLFPAGPGPYGAGVSELAYFDVFETVAGHRFSTAWQDAFRAWL